MARAERRPHCEVGGLTVARVDRREGAVGGDQLADADANAARAHRRGEQGEPAGQPRPKPEAAGSAGA